MTNNTDVYWEANGLSLHTHAWSAETKAGRMASAGKKGEDYALPYRSGRTKVRKNREARTENLPMWVTCKNIDGTDDDTMSKKAKVEQNWNYLMSYLDVPGDFALVKRFYDDGVVRTVTGRAELIDPPDITIAAKNTWRFSLELFMADPWFYGSEVTASAGTITVAGNVETERVVLQLASGARLTTPDGNYVQFNGSGTATIDCYNGTAKVGSTYVNGLLERNPRFPEWLRLQPGVNVLSGSGTLTYQPAYR